MNIQLLPKNILAYTAQPTHVTITVTRLASLLWPVWTIVIYRRQNLRLSKARTTTILPTKLLHLVSRTLENCSTHLTNAFNRIITRVIRPSPPSNFALHTTKHMLMGSLRSISRKNLAALLTREFLPSLLASNRMVLTILIPTFSRTETLLSRCVWTRRAKEISTLLTSNQVICLSTISRAKVQATSIPIARPTMKLLAALRANTCSPNLFISAQRSTRTATSSPVYNWHTAIHTHLTQASILVRLHTPIIPPTSNTTQLQPQVN